MVILVLLLTRPKPCLVVNLGGGIRLSAPAWLFSGAVLGSLLAAGAGYYLYNVDCKSKVNNNFTTWATIPIHRVDIHTR